jgi:hypothetical protein
MFVNHQTFLGAKGNTNRQMRQYRAGPFSLSVGKVGWGVVVRLIPVRRWLRLQAAVAPRSLHHFPTRRDLVFIQISTRDFLLHERDQKSDWRSPPQEVVTMAFAHN